MAALTAATDMPWLKSYPEGVSWSDPLAISTVPHMLANAAQRWPQKLALEFEGRSWTYLELHDAVEAMAWSMVRRLSMCSGEVVAILMPNHPHLIICALAVMRSGGTVVLLSPLDAPASIKSKLVQSKARFLVLDAALSSPALEIGITQTHCKVVASGAPWAGSAGAAAPCVLGDLLDETGPPVALPDPRPEDVALLQFTGGTTGVPKAAILAHANLTAACEQYHRVTRGDPPILEEGQELVLLCLPLFHIYAFTANLLFAMRMGSGVVLQQRFDADAVLHTIEERAITVFCGVPTMYTLLIESARWRSMRLESLKFCLSGGAPLSAEVHLAFEKLTGLRLTEGWGMTETASAGCYAPATGPVKVGSCGLPLPGVEIRIVDLSDPEIDTSDGQGELCIRGPNVMSRYLGHDQENDAGVFTSDGFLRTGDIVRMDEDGYIYIVDRLKDMLLCGGYNVYPRTIEAALYAHPAILDVLVIGIPDPVKGQVPKAFIQLRADSQAPTLAELQEFLRDRIGKHEMIYALEIREELPRTAVGKLSKKSLVATSGQRA